MCGGIIITWPTAVCFGALILVMDVCKKVTANLKKKVLESNIPLAEFIATKFKLSLYYVLDL